MVLNPITQINNNAFRIIKKVKFHLLFFLNMYNYLTDIEIIF